MATAIIQLPLDGTGKMIAARSYTENSNTVYAQAGYLTTDTALGNPAEVRNVDPEPGDYGLVVRPISDSTMVLLYDQIEGTALNTNIWTGQNTTMTTTQSGGFINLNASSLTTINTNAQIQSIKTFARFGFAPMIGRFGMKQNVGAQANAVQEIGFGFATARSAPTDGVFFRWDTNGFRGVLNYGGTETFTSTFTALTANAVSVLEIHIAGRDVRFVIDKVLVGTITATAANSGVLSVDRFPVFARTYTLGSAPSTAPVMNISRVTVLQTDAEVTKAWGEQLSDGQARGSFQSPQTTFTATANWPNAAAPTTRTLSNTASAEATLGGLVAFTPQTTANTDYILFGYQVPAGYQLKITGVNISGPTLLSGTGSATARNHAFALAVNSSAVSAATADALGPPPTTWAPRRIPLGNVNLPAAPTAATASNPAQFQVLFTTPVVCEAGRFVHLLMRYVGAAPAIGTSEVHEVTAGIFGYFE